MCAADWAQLQLLLKMRFLGRSLALLVFLLPSYTKVAIAFPTGDVELARHEHNVKSLSPLAAALQDNRQGDFCLLHATFPLKITCLHPRIPIFAHALQLTSDHAQRLLSQPARKETPPPLSQSARTEPAAEHQTPPAMVASSAAAAPSAATAARRPITESSVGSWHGAVREKGSIEIKGGREYGDEYLIRWRC